MHRSHRFHAAASSAALLGAAVVLVGCDDGDESSAVDDGQVQMNETDISEMDPNELPEGVGGEDETLGDSQLDDSTKEEPGVTEYDSAPLNPGDAAD